MPLEQEKNEPCQEKTCSCICENFKNKGADQLGSNHAADQCLWFRNFDSIIHLFPKSQISSLLLSPVAVQSGLSWAWLETVKTGFLKAQLKKELWCSRQKGTNKQTSPC